MSNSLNTPFKSNSCSSKLVGKLCLRAPRHSFRIGFSPTAHLQNGDIGIRPVLERDVAVLGCALSCYGQHGLWCPVKALLGN